MRVIPWRLNSLLPELDGFYDFLLGRNGLFMRVERPEMRAVVPLQRFSMATRMLSPFNGFEDIRPFFSMRRLPNGFLYFIQQRRRVEPHKEHLFYCSYDRHEQEWVLIYPDQIGEPGSVRPVDEYDPDYQIAVAEFHTHPTGYTKGFSPADDHSEKMFRIYGVLEYPKPDAAPSLKLRLGVYGHYYELTRTQVFE